MARKHRIAFTAIHYPVAMSRYFWEALLRRKDVELWSFGPFTGNWIPWAGGMHLPAAYMRKPDMPMPFGNPPVSNYSLAQAKAPWQPDLWLEVNAGLAAIGRPTNAPLFVVGTDPHVLDYADARGRADRFYCMQTPYQHPGDFWLPYAYDPIWHSPTPIALQDRAYDVSLVGLQYPQRTEIFNRLQAVGMRVFYELGKAYEDAAAIYHATRVGLNFSSLLDTTARVFELMAFGIAPVLNRVPDLMAMFKDGEDFIGFDTADQAVAAIEGLIANPDRCMILGEQARRAVEAHTWDARIRTIMKDAGLM